MLQIAFFQVKHLLLNKISIKITFKKFVPYQPRASRHVTGYD